MTAKELIELLKELPENEEIHIYVESYEPLACGTVIINQEVTGLIDDEGLWTIV